MVSFPRRLMHTTVRLSRHPYLYLSGLAKRTGLSVPDQPDVTQGRVQREYNNCAPYSASKTKQLQFWFMTSGIQRFNYH